MYVVQKFKYLGAGLDEISSGIAWNLKWKGEVESQNI